MPVQNAEIAAMFDQTADLLEFKGENQFRVRAYHRAARTIEGLPQSVRSLLSAQKDLTELPGIGKDLAGKIADIVKTGHFNLLDSLKKKLPGELGDMAALPGLGPKRVRLLYDKLKVRTLDDLRRAIKRGRLHELRGFGAGDGKETGWRAGKAGGGQAFQAGRGRGGSRGAGRIPARRRPRSGGRQLSPPARHGGRSGYSGHLATGASRRR